MNIYRNIFFWYSLWVIVICAQEKKRSFEVMSYLSRFFVKEYCNTFKQLSNKEIKQALDNCHLIFMFFLHRQEVIYYLNKLDLLLLQRYAQDAPIPLGFISIFNKYRAIKNKEVLAADVIYQRPSLYKWWSVNHASFCDVRKLDIHGSPLAYLNNVHGLRIIPSIGLVTRINFAHHHFEKIEKDFCNLSQLKKLFLQHNCIQRLCNKSFIGCTFLRTIDLSHNGITDIGTAFKGLAVLKKLLLSDNKIKHCETNAFEGCNSLSTLNLNNNNLVALQGCCARLTALRRLFMAHNNIDHLESLDFSNNTQLESINVSYNKLTDISNIFHHFPQLLTLNVSYNNIECLKERTFMDLPKLRILMHDHNPLKEIESNYIESCNNLT